MTMTTRVSELTALNAKFIKEHTEHLQKLQKESNITKQDYLVMTNLKTYLEQKEKLDNSMGTKMGLSSIETLVEKELEQLAKMLDFIKKEFPKAKSSSLRFSAYYEQSELVKKHKELENQIKESNLTIETLYTTLGVCRTCNGKGHTYESPVGSDPYARSSDGKETCKGCLGSGENFLTVGSRSTNFGKSANSQSVISKG